VSEDEFSAQIDAGEGLTILSVSGEIDLANVDEFDKALAEASAQGVEVHIDVGQLAFIDSAGFAAIQRAAAAAPFRLVVPGDCATARSFAVSGLAEVLPVYRTRDEARAAAAEGPD
jgi:anti-anti-sigma factor